MPLAGTEKLAVEDGGVDLAGLGEGLAFGNRVEGAAVARRVEERGERVRFAAAEGRDEFQHAIARTAGQAREHVLQQRLQAVGEVGRAKELLRVAIDGGHLFVAVGKRPQVEREDVLGKIGRENVRVKLDRLDPRFDDVDSHSRLLSG